MSRILITGASGFIGSNLARELVKTQNEVSIFVRKGTKPWRINDILSDCDIHAINLINVGETKNAIQKIKPDIVYHCAAYGISQKQNDADKIFRTNISGTTNLLIALEEYNKLERLVNVGSYLEHSLKPDYYENGIRKSIDPYTVSKVYQTELVQYFNNKKNIPAVTLRLFNPYGKFEEPGRLVSDIMISILQKKSLEVFSGSARHDFIHIDDVISVLQNAAKKPNIEGKIFDVGNGKEISVKDIVELTCNITNTNLKIKWRIENQSRAEKDIDKQPANIQKTKKLDWKPKISIKKGLLKTFDWYKEHIDLYKNFRLISDFD